MFEKFIVGVCVALIVGFIGSLEAKRNSNRIQNNAKRKGISLEEAYEDEELRQKKLARNMRIFMLVGFLSIVVLIIVMGFIYGWD